MKLTEDQAKAVVILLNTSPEFKMFVEALADDAEELTMRVVKTDFHGQTDIRTMQGMARHAVSIIESLEEARKRVKNATHT